MVALYDLNYSGHKRHLLLKMFVVVAVSVFFISFPHSCSRNGAACVQVLGKGYLQGRLKLTILCMQICTELGISIIINVTKILDIVFSRSESEF